VATLVNPSGWRVYWELYQTLIDRSVLDRIAEWVSVSLFHPASYNLVLVMGLVLFLLAVNRWRFDLTKLVIAMVMFGIGISSWRHAPLFVVSTIPLLSEQFAMVVDRGLRDIFRTSHILMAVAAVVVAAGWWNFHRLQPTFAGDAAYAQTHGYPYGAVQWLKHNPEVGTKLFNDYDWGGYLIWKLPERKVFIDGRMAIWRNGETSVFNDFFTVVGSEQADALAVLDSWGADIALTRIEASANLFLGWSPDWRLVYQDGISAIWLKQSLQPVE